MENSNSNSNSIVSREKIDHVAWWLSATVSSAFFHSLERFSCVNVATEESDDEDSEEEQQNDDAPKTENDVSNLPV